MKTPVYLVFNSKGFIKSGKKPLTCGPGEVQVKVNVQIPDSHFYRPALVANILINDELPTEIPAEVQASAKDALENLGFKVELNFKVNE